MISFDHPAVLLSTTWKSNAQEIHRNAVNGRRNSRKGMRSKTEVVQAIKQVMNKYEAETSTTKAIWARTVEPVLKHSAPGI